MKKTLSWAEENVNGVWADEALELVIFSFLRRTFLLFKEEKDKYYRNESRDSDAQLQYPCGRNKMQGAITYLLVNKEEHRIVSCGFFVCSFLVIILYWFPLSPEVSVFGEINIGR